MKKIDVLKTTLIFVLLVISVYFFPTFGKDITWSLKTVSNMKEFFTFSNLGILPNLGIIFFTKYKIIKVCIMTVITILIFLLMKNIVNKKNSILLSLSLFLFMLIDNTFFSEVFVSIEGFAVHMISSLFIMTFVYIIIKNNITKMHPLILLIMGLSFGLINTTYVFAIFIISLIYILNEIKEGFKSSKYFFLILGEVIGMVITSLTTTLTYTGLSHNLLEEFIPRIIETNFLIVLIYSALILFSSVKVVLNGHTIGAILSIIGISSFLFSSLLTSSIYINYITYCLFTVSTLYILTNMTTSPIFKRKVFFYFVLKIIYIILLSLFGSISYASTILLYLIDILLIIELYDYIFPNDFLNVIWEIAVLLVFSSNIYIYSSVAKKYDEMNFYIKNKLECTKEDFTLPSKYKTDYLHDYLPNNKELYKNYIQFYNIDVYEKEKVIKIDFRE